MNQPDAGLTALACNSHAFKDMATFAIHDRWIDHILYLLQGSIAQLTPVTSDDGV